MALRLNRSMMVNTAMQPDRAFADWYVDTWMAQEMPEHTYRQDPEALKDMTLSARGYARHFGILDAESQMVFVTLCWDMGPGFFLWPGFHEIVTDPALSGPEKIARFDTVPEHLAVEAIMGRDSSLWFDAPLPPMPPASRASSAAPGHPPHG